MMDIIISLFSVFAILIHAFYLYWCIICFYSVMDFLGTSFCLNFSVMDFSLKNVLFLLAYVFYRGAVCVLLIL